MPYSLSTRNRVNDLVHGKTAFTLPQAFIGLSTTTPSGTDTNVTEPVGNSYARVTTTGATWTASTAGAIDSAAVITFPTATAAGWGTVSHVVAYDALTGGTLLWWAAITAQAVAAGVTVTIPAGSADTLLS